MLTRPRLSIEAKLRLSSALAIRCIVQPPQPRRGVDEISDECCSVIVSGAAEKSLLAEFHFQLALE
jgi:hypothetical protein